MHNSEWLNDAKSVPCGRSKRVYHGAENRPNLVVYNNTDSWSAYCHSCKASGKVYKEYLTPVDTTLPPTHKYLSYNDLMSIQDYKTQHSYEFNGLVRLLHDKGMSLTVLAELNPMMHKLDKRLVFQFKDFAVGRDVLGCSKSKWFHYYTPTPMKSLYLQNKKAASKHCVLVEDLFSAQKIRYYTPYHSMWLGGTKLDDSTFSFIVANKIIPVIMTDGDDAGWKCRDMLKRKFELFGIPYHVVNIPDGLDPKDMKPIALNKIIQGALNGSI